MAYVDLTSRFVYELQTVFGDFSKLANNDKFIKENGWEDGTIALFCQAAAPTGWTKVTTLHGKALRVVSGFGGGVGGATDPAVTITLAHTHVISTDADHTHAADTHIHNFSQQAAQASGSDFPPGSSDIGVNSSGYLRLENAAGGSTQDLVTNEFSTPTSAVVTGANGSHNHGGVTNSQLSDLSLAYLNVLFCSKDTSSGYTDLSATFVHNTRHVYDYLEQCAQNDAFNYARRTPAGTVSIFASANAPTGWTRLATQDAKMLRVVSDATTGGNTGGATDPADSVTLAHDHGALTSDGGHTHTIPNHQHQLKRSGTHSVLDVSNPIWATGAGALLHNSGSSGGASEKIIHPYTSTDGSGSSSSNGAHQHTTVTALANIGLAYLNVIQASKDSAGAPASYNDRTGFFVDQDLLAYQDLQYMANNDAYLYYHIMPSAAVMFFFQSAAPLNWTKATSQNDKCLRIVDGGSTAGGTTGGSTPLSQTISLAHTHGLDSQSHTHNYSHSHAVDTDTATVFTTSGVGVVYAGAGEQLRQRNTGSAASALLLGTDSTLMTMDSKSHNHGGTNSALADVTLAYADVIMCSKN